MWHEWERIGMHTGFLRENVKKRNHLEDVGVDRRVILKWNLRKKHGIAGVIRLPQERKN
jgi:transcription termination factor Rho